MKKLFLLFSILLSLPVFPQNDSPVIIHPDSPVIKTRVEKMPPARRPNLEYIMETVEKNREKEKRSALIRFGIGIFFLVILVIGLLRRRAARNKSSA